MEEDEIETQACKLPRVENGSDGSRKRFHSWHPSSRIIRVSRASGGKDRHSKVMTSKGSRDRRVRLSVSTAIQFYDLQDRLGYDQPSKAVEWLIKSAAEAIAELPSLNNTYPPDSDEKRASDEQGFDSADAEVDGENATNHQQNKNNQSQNISLSKSACSSTSETSKCSGLSLSRSVNRVKARERARERTAKEKEQEKENESHNNIVHNVKPISQTVSFTELLTGGMNNAVPTSSSPNQNHAREQWSSSLSAPMDYLSSGLLGASSSSRTHNHNHGFSVSQIQLEHNSLPETMSFHNHNNSSYHNYSQLQQFSLMPADHQQQLMSANGNDDNLNFSISGYNRGTLQSNSPSLLPHFLDGSTVPFFIGTAPTIHNHHHKFSSDHKGKTKN